MLHEIGFVVPFNSLIGELRRRQRGTFGLSPVSGDPSSHDKNPDQVPFF